MQKKPVRPVRWSTSVQALATASTVQDLKSLSLNLAQCRACQGRRFALACAGNAVSRFFAPRLITTAVVFGAVCAALVALS